MNRGCYLLAFILGGGLFIYAAVSAATATAAAQQTPAAPAPVPGHSDSSAHPEIPDPPGKTLLLRTCTKCHQVDVITRQHKDNDAWFKTIIKMVGPGSVATDDEYETILTYVTANYGPLPPGAHAKIEVNKETATELAEQFGLTNEAATAIVTYRAKNGPFKSIDDLKKVPGIDMKKIDDKKDDLIFS